MQDQLCMSGTVVYSVEKCDITCKRMCQQKCWVSSSWQRVTTTFGNRNLPETEFIKVLLNDKVNAVLGDQTTKSFMTKEVIVKGYKDVFEGLGCMGGSYNIDMKPDITPVVHLSWKVPLREPHTKKIEKLVSKKDISPCIRACKLGV